MVAESTVAGHAFLPAHERPAWFVRVRVWLADRWDGLWSGVRLALSVTAPDGDDWTEPEPTSALPRVEMPAVERPAPEHPLFSGQPSTSVGPQVPARRPHPPFAPRPTHCTHLAVRMAHILADAAWNPNLSPTLLASMLREVNAELSELVVAERAMAARMAANVERAAAMGRGLDAVAGAPGVALKTVTMTGPDGEAREVVPDVHAAMSGGVSRMADTGTMPRITGEMPDPREPEPVEAGPEPAAEVVPDHAWTNEELSELGDVVGDEQAAAGSVVAA